MVWATACGVSPAMNCRAIWATTWRLAHRVSAGDILASREARRAMPSRFVEGSPESSWGLERYSMKCAAIASPSPRAG